MRTKAFGVARDCVHVFRFEGYGGVHLDHAYQVPTEIRIHAEPGFPVATLAEDALARFERCLDFEGEIGQWTAVLNRVEVER